MSTIRVPIPKRLLIAVLISVLVSSYRLFGFVTMWRQLPPHAQRVWVESGLYYEGTALLMVLFAPLALLRIRAARWPWLAVVLFWGLLVLPHGFAGNLIVFFQNLLLFSLYLWAIFSAKTAAYAAGQPQLA